jgi:fumarylpyruvate hydrolase
MELAITPVDRKLISVKGTDEKFPVQQIYCVGRNYADHAVEMGHDPDREAPFFFMKPAYSILADGEAMQYPALSHDVHHEVEMVVALGTGGTDLSVEEANRCIYGYAVGIDMTRRDLQAEAKEKRRPWESGKTFLHAAPCSSIIRREETGLIEDAGIALSINGIEKQKGNVNQMIWKIPEVISRLSTLFYLEPGDLIYTGTPAGVGPIQVGDKISAKINGVGTLNVTVGASPQSF